MLQWRMYNNNKWIKKKFVYMWFYCVIYFCRLMPLQIANYYLHFLFTCHFNSFAYFKLFYLYVFKYIVLCITIANYSLWRTCDDQNYWINKIEWVDVKIEWFKKNVFWPLKGLRAGLHATVIKFCVCCCLIFFYILVKNALFAY